MRVRGHEFRLYWPTAQHVDLVASCPPRVTPLKSQGNGWWGVDLPLPEGEFRYTFLIDGVYRVPDYAAGEPQYELDGSLVSVLRHAGGTEWTAAG